MQKDASRSKSKTETRRLRLEEDKRLLEISQSKETGNRVKQRAEAIRLSSHGRKVAQIAAYFEWHEQTVREIIQRWKREGEQGLYDLLALVVSPARNILKS